MGFQNLRIFVSLPPLKPGSRGLCPIPQFKRLQLSPQATGSKVSGMCPPRADYQNSRTLEFPTLSPPSPDSGPAWFSSPFYSESRMYLVACLGEVSTEVRYAGGNIYARSHDTPHSSQYKIKLGEEGERAGLQARVWLSPCCYTTVLISVEFKNYKVKTGFLGYYGSIFVKADIENIFNSLLHW